MFARQASATLQARCPDCGSRYSGSGSRFLYSDEDGIRCPECGSILVEEAAPGDGGPYAYCLTIPERLENSELHWRLKKLARGDGARVLVDRTGSARPLSSGTLSGLSGQIQVGLSPEVYDI